MKLSIKIFSYLIFICINNLKPANANSLNDDSFNHLLLKGSNITNAIDVIHPINNDTLFIYEPDTIKIKESDGFSNIDSIEFYVNNVKIGIDTNTPFKYNWTPALIGHNLVIAIAIGDQGSVLASDTIGLHIKHAIQPTVDILSPTLSDTIIEKDIITIKADASDNDGNIKNVYFYINNQLVSEDSVPPYEYKWTSFAGKNIILKTIANDNDGLSSAPDAITINVQNNKNPSVDIILPVDSSVLNLNEVFTIEATAFDLDGSIDSVVFFVNDQRIGNDTVAPFKLDHSESNYDTIQIIAMAFDNKGATSFDTIMAYKAQEMNVLPVVMINNPVQDTIFKRGSIVPININASDPDGFIQYVDVYINSIKLTTDSTSPYLINWHTNNNGNYTISAIALDDKGATTNSAVSIRVTEDGSSGINELSMKPVVSINPNPVSDLLNITIHPDPSKTVYTFTIYDMYGKVMKKGKINKVLKDHPIINVSDYNRGMYFIEFVIDGIKYSKKFLMD